MKKYLIYLSAISILFLQTPMVSAREDGKGLQNLFQAKIETGLKAKTDENSPVVENITESTIIQPSEAERQPLDYEAQEDSPIVEANQDTDKKEVKEGIVHKGLVWFKGKPAKTSATLGMFSYHTGPNRKKYNGDNKMMSVQYKGYAAGYFENSYYRNSYFAGVSREVYNKQINKALNIDVTYKAGGIYGYYDRYPNICNVSPIILPYMGVTLYGVGADIGIIPSHHPILTINFKANKDTFKQIFKRNNGTEI